MIYNNPMSRAELHVSYLDQNVVKWHIKKQIKKMIDIISRDKSVIVITHDDEMTVGMDRIITLDKGKIISDIKGSKNKLTFFFKISIGGPMRGQNLCRSRKRFFIIDKLPRRRKLMSFK